MRSFGIAAFVVLSSLFVLAGRARAATEFCPADIVTWQAVSPDNSGPLNQTGPSTLYALQLSALSARTLDATVVIETDAGWYGAALSAVQLTRTLGATEGGAYTAYVERFLSPVVYVRFPSSVHVQRMWVGSATVSSDVAFLWAGKGRFDCDPHSSEALNPQRMSAVLTHDIQTLRSAPLPSAQRAIAIAIAAPDGLGCAKPFVSARGTHPVAPAYPDIARGEGFAPYVIVDAAVSIDAAGRVVDAWPISQFAAANGQANAFVAATLDAARKSSYSPAVALCRPVSGTYTFRADFAPRR